MLILLNWLHFQTLHIFVQLFRILSRLTWLAVVLVGKCRLFFRKPRLIISILIVQVFFVTLMQLRWLCIIIFQNRLAKSHHSWLPVHILELLLINWAVFVVVTRVVSDLGHFGASKPIKARFHARNTLLHIWIGEFGSAQCPACLVLLRIFCSFKSRLTQESWIEAVRFANISAEQRRKSPPSMIKLFVCKFGRISSLILLTCWLYLLSIQSQLWLTLTQTGLS